MLLDLILNLERIISIILKYGKIFVFLFRIFELFVFWNLSWSKNFLKEKEVAFEYKGNNLCEENLNIVCLFNNQTFLFSWSEGFHLSTEKWQLEDKNFIQSFFIREKNSQEKIIRSVLLTSIGLINSSYPNFFGWYFGQECLRTLKKIHTNFLQKKKIFSIDMKYQFSNWNFKDHYFLSLKI